MEKEHIWMQWYADGRREIVQRQLLFVALESLLFVGFATLVSRGSSWFVIVVAFLGLLSSSIGFFHTKEPARWLENLKKNMPDDIGPLYEKVYEQQTKLERLISKPGKEVGSRWVSIWYPVFFCILWIVSFIYSILNLLAGL